MQDSPARRSPYIFAERPCPDCGKPFTPRSGRQVRCAECREGPAAAVCGQDGCGKQLRRDNKIGYCEPHKRPTARAPERECAADDCERKLRIDNESGYCPDHVRLSQGHRDSLDRLYARLRAETAARPDLRPECPVEGCENRLRSDNATGRCAEHHYAAREMPECCIEGCASRLPAFNTTGRCWDHRQKYWIASMCATDGCDQTVNEDCSNGHCREHRREGDLHKEYRRRYYQSRQVEFQEYARRWRLANGDDHRAAVRAWNAANREARQASHARRRQRVKAAMTAADRRASVERRKAIKDDPCFYCGTSDTSDTDHFFPLAKGGTDHYWNLVRACDTCNSRKNATCGTAFLLRYPPMAQAA